MFNQMLNMFYVTHLHTQMDPCLHKNSPQCHYFYWRLQTVYCAVVKRGFFLRYCKFEHDLPMRRLLNHTPWEAREERKGQHLAKRQAKASHVFRASFIPIEKSFHFNLKSRVFIDNISPRTLLDIHGANGRGCISLQKLTLSCWVHQFLCSFFYKQQQHNHLLGIESPVHIFSFS